MEIHRQRVSSGLATLIGVISLSTASYAAPIYSTTFDDYNALRALSQQGGWSTNDVYVDSSEAGQSDLVTVITGYSNTTEDKWGILGGLSPLAPGLFSVSLTHSFSSAGLLTSDPSSNALRLDVDFAITSSATPRANKDSFSWAFNDASGNTVFRLALEPNSEVTADGLRIKLYGSGDNVFVTPNSIAYNAIYQLQVDVGLFDDTRDALRVSITDGLGDTHTILNDFNLAEGTAASVAAIGTTWDIRDLTANDNGHPTAYGANSILFNDFSISTAPAPVPEPSSALLLGAGALLGFARRQRRS